MVDNNGEVDSGWVSMCVTLATNYGGNEGKCSWNIVGVVFVYANQLLLFKYLVGMEV